MHAGACDGWAATPGGMAVLVYAMDAAFPLRPGLGRAFCPLRPAADLAEWGAPNPVQVREQGESAAVLSMMDSLTGCLAQGGCFAVPGLSMDHYLFTLALSVAGGVVAGSAARLEPQGFVQRRGVWVLLFAPLWATLFINFGLVSGAAHTRAENRALAACLVVPRSTECMVPQARSAAAPCCARALRAPTLLSLTLPACRDQ